MELLANTRKLCVFNRTRESFLSLGVTIADSHLSRLRGLLGRMRLPGDEGLWVVPCNGIHTIGMLFPIDLICLDADNRVVSLEEHVKPFRIVRPRSQCRSVLELPVRTIYSSHTKVGDELLIGTTEETQKYLIEHQTVARKVQWIGRELAPTLRPRHERRSDPRIRGPGLLVFYWDGGVPEPHRVLDICVGGACIEPPIQWGRGTLVDVVVQREDLAGTVFTLQACVVRTERGRTGLAFLHANKVNRRKFQLFLKNRGSSGGGRNGQRSMGPGRG